jgi:hypothetical protein
MTFLLPVFRDNNYRNNDMATPAEMACPDIFYRDDDFRRYKH